MPHADRRIERIAQFCGRHMRPSGLRFALQWEICLPNRRSVRARLKCAITRLSVQPRDVEGLALNVVQSPHAVGTLNGST